jgi:hypothetical protein
MIVDVVAKGPEAAEDGRRPGVAGGRAGVPPLSQEVSRSDLIAVAAAAGPVLVFHAALGERYGFHRDLPVGCGGARRFRITSAMRTGGPTGLPRAW